MGYLFRTFDCITYSFIISSELKQIKRTEKYLKENDMQISNAVTGSSHANRANIRSFYALNSEKEAYSKHKVLNKVE